jgi:hypothetical protein
VEQRVTATPPEACRKCGSAAAFRLLGLWCLGCLICGATVHLAVPATATSS